MNNITKISIVEDRKHIRENLKTHINHTKDLFCISTYDNAEDALKGLVIDKPNVVIMDIGLPEMSGTECMLRVKLKCPEIAFLMYTIFEEDDKIFDALKSGASGYILKESRASVAIKAIREFIDGGGPMTPTIARKVIDSFHKFNFKNELIEELTPSEFNIIRKIAEGKLNKEIADELKTTEGYIKVCISRIYKKIHVNNRVEALNKYINSANKKPL